MASKNISVGTDYALSSSFLRRRRSPKPDVKIVCSWCGKSLREKKPVRDQSVSHTKCKACLRKQARIKKMSLSERANMAMREAVQGVVEDHMRTGKKRVKSFLGYMWRVV